jgi:NAD(P)-dependent dehydrogenase (short-subunit alcohol dehydrogenase family)
MQVQEEELRGRVAIVIGAASPVGRAVARELGRRGAAVVVAVGEPLELRAVAGEIQEAGGKSLVVAADADVFSHLAVVAEAAEREFGALNIWVHVVDAGVPVAFDKLTPLELRHIISGDLIAQAYGAVAAVPVMRRHGGGHLIHVSSADAEAALPFHGAYAAAKEGAKALLDSLRLNFGRQAAAGAHPMSVSNVTVTSRDPLRVARAVASIASAPRDTLIVSDPTPWSWVVRLAVRARVLAGVARRFRLPWVGGRRPVAGDAPPPEPLTAREPFTDITRPDNAELLA